MTQTPNYYLNKFESTDALETTSRMGLNDNADIIDGALTALSEATTYSTTEQVIGTWIDGKPLYRKTINIGALPDTTTKEISHNIANISTITKVYGFATTGQTFYPLPFVYDVTTKTIGLYANVTKIFVWTGNDRSSFTGYVTLEYTKNG